jgi:drug/metabolite transporter (DMT)-like permease
MVAIAILFLATKRGLHLKTVWERQWPRIIAAALGTMTSYSLILHVLQTSPVSYVVSIRQSSVLIAVLVGWLWLKEPYGRYRLVTSMAMLVGLYWVTTANQ